MVAIVAHLQKFHEFSGGRWILTLLGTDNGREEVNDLQHVENDDGFVLHHVEGLPNPLAFEKSVSYGVPSTWWVLCHLI